MSCRSEGWGEGEMVRLLAWGRLPPLSEVALAKRGVSLTRRGRQGDKGTRGNLKLLTSYYSLITTHYLLLTTHYSLLIPNFSPLTTYYSLLTTHYSLLTVHCSLLQSQLLRRSPHESNEFLPDSKLCRVLLMARRRRIRRCCLR